MSKSLGAPFSKPKPISDPVFLFKMEISKHLSFTQPPKKHRMDSFNDVPCLQLSFEIWPMPDTLRSIMARSQPDPSQMYLPAVIWGTIIEPYY
ncbi:uncharacterized protein [Henckelia pumila]|uniref:uncharacterized protein isoform X2 n=1 Tax=Henckelia pumila TaxID=405737 RepID=UPI003C6EA0F6